MKAEKGITQYFGINLAELLSEKIKFAYPDFNDKAYIQAIAEQVSELGYTQRIELHAKELSKCLPEDYERSINILIRVLGPENPNETGMFSSYYWIMPIGKYVELYGLNEFGVSMQAISEITKRNTGEYAIRPFLRKYPDRTIEQLLIWAKSNNFHLRRLASEGSRPKLPWASKLDVFIQNPAPVFSILNVLKEESVKFVQKSVANNTTDYLKVNYEAARALLLDWSESNNRNTRWIVKHATRKIKI